MSPLLTRKECQIYINMSNDAISQIYSRKGNKDWDDFIKISVELIMLEKVMFMGLSNPYTDKKLYEKLPTDHNELYAKFCEKTKEMYENGIVKEYLEINENKKYHNIRVNTLCKMACK